MEEQLLSLVSGRRGHFELESGHHGDLWFQLEGLCRHSRQIHPFAAQLAAKLMQYQVEVVCGPLVEGAFIALLVSLEMSCDFVYAERFSNTARQGLYTVKYRLPAALQSVVKGKRVAIVNDVINAGSAVIGTFIDLQSIRANVVAIGALLALVTRSTRLRSITICLSNSCSICPTICGHLLNVRSVLRGNRSKLSAHPKGTCAVNRPVFAIPVSRIPAICLCNDAALEPKGELGCAQLLNAFRSSALW